MRNGRPEERCEKKGMNEKQVKKPKVLERTKQCSSIVTESSRIDRSIWTERMLAEPGTA